jgi:hypothetical protein
MDVSKYMKQKNNWIFDDTFQTETIGTFLDAKEWLTNAGKKADVFMFAVEGTDYMIMPFKVDYTDFVEKYGQDTDKWKGKHFILNQNKKGKYVITHVEETIQ